MFQQRDGFAGHRSGVNRSRTAASPARPVRSRSAWSLSIRRRPSASSSIVRLDQQPAAGCFDQLRERAVARLHDRHAVGPRFQDVQPLRLAVHGRHAQHVDRLQEPNLVGVRRALDVLEVGGKPGGFELLHLFVEVGAVVLAEPAARLQLRGRRAGYLPQADERIDEVVKALLRADAGEVADRERAARCGPARRRDPRG